MQEEIPFSLLEILILRFGRMVGFLIPIILGVALLLFFIGLVRFMYHADNENERRRGQQTMVWGVAILFVMTSIWGIISFIGENLMIDQGGTYRSPTVELPSVETE